MQYTIHSFFTTKHNFLSTDIWFYSYKYSSITKFPGTFLKFHGTPVGNLRSTWQHKGENEDKRSRRNQTRGFNNEFSWAYETTPHPLKGTEIRNDSVLKTEYLNNYPPHSEFQRILIDVSWHEPTARHTLFYWAVCSV